MGVNEIRFEISEDMPYVSFMTVDPQNSDNSGGGDHETTVGNIHFLWNTAAGGFTDTEWWGTGITNGPTAIGGFTSDDAVREYLSTPGNNLNDAFRAWQDFIDTQDIWDQPGIVSNFATALEAQGGQNCMMEG